MIESDGDPFEVQALAGGVSFRVLSRREFLAFVAAGMGATVVTGGVKALLTAPARAAPAVPQTGGRLVYALVSVDDRFDPAATTFISVGAIVQHITEPLVWELAPGKFSPGLAESWTVSPDGKAFTFKLKQGVRFHDGTPFTAEAVKFTMDRIVSPLMVAGVARSRLGPYERTEILDAYTCSIVMKAGYAPLLSTMNPGFLGIVSPTAVERMGDARFLFSPVGTGPFVWKEFAPNDHITLVRNPDYAWGAPTFHRGPAYLDEIIYKLVPQPAVRTGVLLTGEVHYINDVDPLAVDRLRQDARFVVVQRPQIGVPHTLLLNLGQRTDTGRPALTSELAVRQAICYGLDREGLVRTIYRGNARAAWNFLPPESWAYDQVAAQMYRYDPARADRILEEAGWRVGRDRIRGRGGQRLTIELVFRAQRDEPRSEFIQGSLRTIGIDVKLTALEVAAQRAAIRGGNYEGVYTWTIHGDPDALREPFHTTGVFNRSQYSNPQIDTWLDQAVSLVSRVARKPLYANVQRQVMRDAVGVPFAHSYLVDARRAEVMDTYVDGHAATAVLHDAWMRRR